MQDIPDRIVGISAFRIEVTQCATYLPSEKGDRCSAALCSGKEEGK